MPLDAYGAPVIVMSVTTHTVFCIFLDIHLKVLETWPVNYSQRSPKVFECQRYLRPKPLEIQKDCSSQLAAHSFHGGAGAFGESFPRVFKTAGLQDVESGVCEGNSDLKAHRSSDTKPIAGGIAQRI